MKFEAEIFKHRELKLHDFLMKFSFLFFICIRAIPIEPGNSDTEVGIPEVTTPEVERLKNAIYAPLMALKRSREDRVGLFSSVCYSSLLHDINHKIHEKSSEDLKIDWCSTSSTLLKIKYARLSLQFIELKIQMVSFWLRTTEIDRIWPVNDLLKLFVQQNQRKS